MTLASWLHACIIVPLITFWEHRVLTPWEELVTSSIRYGFQEAARIINGVSSWLLSFFNAKHREGLKEAWQHNPWQKWWGQVEDRPNTLNALLAALTQQQTQEDQQQQDEQSADGTHVVTDSQGRPLYHRSGFERSASAAPDPQLHHPAVSHPRHTYHHTQQSSIRPARSAGANVASGSGRARRPETAGRGQTVQQQSWWNGRGGTARTQPGGKAKLRPGDRGAQKDVQRPVMFLQQSGMGVIDAASARMSRTTGLLEDMRLGVEVHTARAFATARSLVRSLAGLPPLTPRAMGGEIMQSATGAALMADTGALAEAAVQFGASGTGTEDVLGSPEFHQARVCSDGAIPGLWRPAGANASSTSDYAASVAQPVTVPRSQSAHVSLKRACSLSLPHAPISSLPSPTSPLPNPRLHHVAGSSGAITAGPKGTARPSGLRRATSFSAWEEVVSGRDVVAGDVIRLAGYPFLPYTATTEDGYILTLERIPRQGSRDVVVFLHGLMDTSMSWVSAGVTGSQAFAAWESGFDVWLGNSRCNAPLAHVNPSKSATSPAYWRFSVNELGENDVGALLRRIHEVKCAELPPQEGQARPYDAPVLHHANTTRSAAVAPAASKTTLPARPKSAFLTRTSEGPSTTEGRLASWASRACNAISDSILGPRPASVNANIGGTGTARMASCSPFGGTSNSWPTAHGSGATSTSPYAASSRANGLADGHHLSTSGSEEFYDALDNASGAAAANGNGGRGLLTRSAVSDGDLIAAGAGSTAKGRAAEAAALVWQRRQDGQEVAAAPSRVATGVRQRPDPSLPWQDDPAPEAPKRKATLISHGLSLSSALHSPEAPSTPCPSSPHRSPIDKAQASLNPTEVPADCPAEGKPQQSGEAPGAGGSGALPTILWPAAAAASAAASVISHFTPSVRRSTSTSNLPSTASMRDPRAALSRTRPPSATKINASDSAHGFRSSLPTRASSNGNTPAAAQGSMHRRASTQSAPPPRPGVLTPGNEPYRLRLIAHSLGGMSVLVYLNRMAAQGKPSHIHRAVLLTPAGFHNELPLIAFPVSYVFPLGLWIFRGLTWYWWRRVKGWRPALPLFIPTTTVRSLLFKLMADLRKLPSMAELFKEGMKLMTSNDASEWDRAVQMPHYSAKAMPAVSMDAVLHMTQSARSGHFRLFDYGSASANREVYGQPVPPDVAEEYWRLGNLPIDLVAGRYDGIIPPGNVRMHYQAMMAAGLKVTYKEFEFGHLDFTFAVKDELRQYLMRLLRK